MQRMLKLRHFSTWNPTIKTSTTCIHRNYINQKLKTGSYADLRDSKEHSKAISNKQKLKQETSKRLQQVENFIKTNPEKYEETVKEMTEKVKREVNEDQFKDKVYYDAYDRTKWRKDRYSRRDAYSRKDSYSQKDSYRQRAEEDKHYKKHGYQYKKKVEKSKYVKVNRDL